MVKLFRSFPAGVVWMMLLCQVAFAGGDFELLVSKGDSLINLCRDYLDDPNDWRQVALVNAVRDPNLIQPGERLIIPAELLKGTPTMGKATFVRGNAEIQQGSQGTWKPLEVGREVREADRVRTGADSSLELGFEDGSSLMLRSDTTVAVRKLRARNFGDVIQDLFLNGGRIISRIKKVPGREPRFKIRTPSALTAARGTEFRVAVDRKNDTRVEVLQGTVAAGSRGKGVSLDEGEGILIRKGQIADKAIKLLDPPSLVNTDRLFNKMPMILHLSHVEGAVAYRVMLASDASMKNLVKDIVSSSAGPVAIDGVADGEYFFQVQSVDSLGLEGIPSEPSTVKVRTNPVSPFVQFPADRGEYKTVNMNFQWLKVEDAEKYHLQISRDPDFHDLLDDLQEVKAVEYKKTELGLGTYYYRIRSIAADGYAGAWSDTQRFTLLEPPPEPSAEPPMKSRKEIHVRWKDMGEGVSYHFQMSRQKDFRETLVDEKVSAPQYVLQKPKKAGTYYVRVSTINAEGFEGSFCPPQSFQIKRFPWEILGMGGTFLTVVLLGVL